MRLKSTGGRPRGTSGALTLTSVMPVDQAVVHRRSSGPSVRLLSVCSDWHCVAPWQVDRGRATLVVSGVPSSSSVPEPPRWFDRAVALRVPLTGRTGVDRCRMSTDDPQDPLIRSGKRRFPRVGGASRTGQAPRPGPRPTPRHRRQSREQAYVPAEQPSSPQDARFPPADAHPCRPRHPGVAPPQGPQPSGSLTDASSVAVIPCSPPRGARC